MSDAAVTTNSLWKDSYLAYIPLLGASLALTFDFGYFSALNLSFFTLFSLSEHILFAIQAFPIALVFILLGLIVGGILLNFPSLLKSPQPAPPSKQLRGVPLVIAVAVVTMIIIGVISVFAYLLYSTPILTPLTIEAFIIFGGWTFINDPYRGLFTAAAVVAFLLTLSFFVGYGAAASATIATPSDSIFKLETGTINLKNGELITGRIIRSGDHGVLIYDPKSDRLRFILSDGIRSIDAQPLHLHETTHQ
jgi:hypothetical protein